MYNDPLTQWEEGWMYYELGHKVQDAQKYVHFTVTIITTVGNS